MNSTIPESPRITDLARGVFLDPSGADTTQRRRVPAGAVQPSSTAVARR